MEEKIRRFPRTVEGRKRLGLPWRTHFLGLKNLENGRIPKGYDRLTKKCKRVIKYIINGMAVRDACDKVNWSTNRYYRWMNYSPPFKAFYIQYAKKQSVMVQERLDAKVGRAVTVVENSLDSPDPYFAHDVAVEFLKGRGHYKKNVEGRQFHTGAIMHGVTGTVKTEVMDKELISMFVNALVGKARGDAHVNAEQHEPKIINAKVLKKLPEKIHSGIDTKISQVVEAETVRHDQSS